MTVSPDVEQAVFDALVGMLADDEDTTADAIDRIYQHGPKAVYGAICGWSNISLTAAGGTHDGPPGWQLQAEVVATGDIVNADHTGMRREDLDAMRLIVMWGNQDHDTMTALVKAYLAEPDPGPLVKLMIAVLRIAASCAKEISGITDPT